MKKINIKYIFILIILVSFSMAIYYKYIFLENNKVFALEKSQKQWLDNLQAPLKIGITQIPNQVLVKNSKIYRGFSIDLFRKISEIIGIDFEYVYFQTWEELMRSARDKKIDIVFLAQKNKKRVEYFDFTDTVLLQKNKIITKINSQQVYNLDSDSNLKVSISKGSAIARYIKVNYPNVKIIYTKDEREALSFVAEGKTDFTVLEPVRASYYMNKYNIESLRVYNEIDYDYELKIASNNELMIGSILQKSVNSISDNYMQSLYLKWGYISQNDEYLANKIIIYMWIAFGLLWIYIIYLYLSNRKEKIEKMISKKINADLEKKIKEAIKENTKQLQLLQQQTKMAQMGEMIGAIAHQWRQPLNTITTGIQNLKYDYMEGKLEDEVFVKEFINEQKNTIKFMSTTIDDFRNFFRVDKEKSNFYIKKSIESVVTMLSSSIDKNSIQLNISGDEFEYFGFESEFQQVVMNIINNAKDILIEKN
ncbi:MAG: hypothetical protein DRG78_21130, partial [Epsilonproteobacteria bacterium]